MKKIIYIILAAVLSASFSLSAMAAVHEPFYKSNIENYDSRKDYYIDRGELAKYMSKLYTMLSNKTLPKSNLNLSDVDESQYPYIADVAEAGIMPDTNNKFYPQKTVSGIEFAKILVNTINTAYPNTKKYNHSSYSFLTSRGIWDSTAGISRSVTLKNVSNMIDNTLSAAPDFREIKKTDTLTNKNKINANRPPKSTVTEGKVAYLTFDDSTSENTIKILDTLKQYGIKGTFYITGTSNPEIIKRIADEGHAIGNHTFSHDYEYIYSSKEAFFEDFYKEEAFLESIIGYKPKLVRLPGGSNNTVSLKYGGENVMKEITKELTEKGYIYTDWNSEAKDASTKNITPEQVKANIFETASKREKAIVLMHQTKGKEATAEALPSVIEEFKAQGFKFDVISDTSYNAQFLK